MCNEKADIEFSAHDSFLESPLVKLFIKI